MICIMAGILIAVALYSVNRQKAFMESCSKELKTSLLQAQEVKCDLEEMMLNTINMSRELVDDLERRMNTEAYPEPAVLSAAQSAPGHRTEAQDAFSKKEVLATRPEELSLPPGLVIGSKKPGKSESPSLPEQKPEVNSNIKTMPAAVFNSRLEYSSMVIGDAPELRTSTGAATDPRVHELAEELKTTSKEVLNICRQLGLPVNHHMKVLSVEQVAAIKAHWFFGEQYMEPIHATSQQRIVAGAAPIEKSELKKAGGDRGHQFSMDEIKQAHPYLAVRTLCEQGYDQKEIARILGRGQSEINLIINLTKRKMASNA